MNGFLLSLFQLFPANFDEEKSCPLFVQVDIIPCISTRNAMDIFHDMINRNTGRLQYIPIVYKPTIFPLPVYA